VLEQIFQDLIYTRQILPNLKSQIQKIENANLTDAIFIYGNLKNSKLMNSNLTRTNFMWSDLRNCDFSGCKFNKTVFVEAKLQNAKLDRSDNESIYLKFAKLE
jgi:uncharacterized protein YjbI with pentapeptide repeats